MEGRVINHHGRPLKVSEGDEELFERTTRIKENNPTYENIIQRNDDGLAKKKFYDIGNLGANLLKIGEFTGR